MTNVPSTKTQNRLCTSLDANIKKNIEYLVPCYNAFDFEKQISSYLKLCHEKKTISSISDQVTIKTGLVNYMDTTRNLKFRIS